MAILKIFKSRSNVKVKVTRSKLWYHVKGLVTMTTHVQYESSITSGLKVMAKVKVFQKKVKLQGQCHKVKKLSYHEKGLVIRNTHIKYESSTFNGSKVIANANFFLSTQPTPTLTRTSTRTLTLGLWHYLPEHSSWLAKNGQKWHFRQNVKPRNLPPSKSANII